MIGTWRAVRLALMLCALLLAAYWGRRWVNHARYEMAPVVIPVSAEDGSLLRPTVSAYLRRLGRDVHDALVPPTRRRYAVLTFDDGPYPVTTPALLAELHRLGVPADFFFIGRNAIEQPAIAARAAAAGMEIGNHTLSHPQMTSLVFAAQLEEIADGASALRRITGREVRLFRPPHGNYDAATLEAAHAAGQTFALWDVEPGDWRPVTSTFVANFVVTHAKSPAVILLHDGTEPTIEALPRIVAAYRAAGYEFVTLSELMKRLPLDDINDPLNVTI
jgi:peptidoglycan-N-acetylglucosamine deacetylase